MQTSTQLDLDKPIKDILDDSIFQGVVYDFYHSRGFIDPPSSGDILKEIFQDVQLFHDFLNYCRNNTSFFANDETLETDKSIVILHVIDCLKGIQRQYVDHILQMPQKKVPEKMKDASMNGIMVDAWTALQNSIRNGIPVNNRGEVIYTLEDIPGGYKVFSYRSREHEVNYKGEVIRENLENKGRRCVTLRRIQKYQRCLYLISSGEDGDNKDPHLLQEVIKIFESHVGKSWKSMQEDPYDSGLYSMKFRFFILGQIRDLESEYVRLQNEDKQFGHQLRIVS